MSTLKLKVQNYRRFAETQEIAFQPGLTIISGLNGAGKSTLVEAILVALFGSGRDSSIDGIRTDKSKGDPLVECDLFIDDQLIHILRIGNSVEVSINGVIQVMRGPSSAKAANKRVSALLGGLSRNQFESSFVAIQGDTAGLVQYKAKERRILIERILQLEVLARAVELQGKRRDTAKSDLVALGNVICDELSFSQDIRRPLDNFQSARVVHMHMQYAQNFMASIEQALSDQSGKLKEVKGNVSTAQSHESDLKKKLNVRLSTIEQAVLAHQQHEERQKRYNALQEEIATIEGKITQVKLDIQKYLDDIRNAKQYAKASADYKQLQKEKERDEKRLSRIPLVMSCYEELIRARTKLGVHDEQLLKLATVDKDLCLAQEKEMHSKQQLNALVRNDPTLDDYEAWKKRSDILEHEEEQYRDALKQLEIGTSDAHCPTCNQPFKEHAREQRIQHLLTWLNETLPPIREQGSLPIAC
jgi:exonuclease SbcC